MPEIGELVGAYRIERKLGEGRMGEVYRALDTRLERSVALKFLAERIAGSAEDVTRVGREARAMAAINHPNIVTVYAVEQVGEVHFLAMELVEGDSLDRLIPERGMPVQEFLQLAIRLADGLTAAHGAGLVHRDLKTAHVMVSRAGRVKLLDLGLAVHHGVMPLVWDDRSVEPAVDSTALAELTTNDGAVAGTPAYMSPEQVLGQAVDHRSDIFSLGVVFYETLTGERPFQGPTLRELAASITTQQPRSVSSRKPLVPRVLSDLVDSCLAKDPTDRPQQVAEVAAALARLRRGEGAGRSVAVVPFVDLSPGGDQRHFSEGIAEGILDGLADVPDLRVASRTSTFRFRSTDRDVGDIGRRLGVETVLEGSVRRAKDRLRIVTRLIDVADDSDLWSQRFEGDVEEVFALEDEITRSVLEALQGVLGTRPPLSQPPDFEAYDYYLRGRSLLYRGTTREVALARDMFSRAVARDPDYAPAHSGLADAGSYLYMHAGGDRGVLDEAIAAAEQAVRSDPRLAEGHAALGLALSLSQRHDEAHRAFATAIELDPDSFEARHSRARAAFARGRLELAAREFEVAGALRSEDFQAPALLSQVYRDLQDPSREVASARRAVRRAERQLALQPGDGRAYSVGARCLFQLGERQAALEWAERALELGAGDAATHYAVACLLAQAGQIDEALARLEDSIRFGYAHRDWIEHDGDWAPIRDDPPFKTILESIELASTSKVPVR
ncbi:MAG TPA: protein kinase [Acidobacteriota bacterium]|nr:protein kinase [Acidobacteriota bacterium]